MPETIHDLKQNRSFTALRSSNRSSIDRYTGDATQSTASTGTLTIRYNAAAKSYTVDTIGGTTTFTPADITNQDDGFHTYRKGTVSSEKQMILLRESLDESAGPQNVAMGLLQQSDLREHELDMVSDVFVYGFSAPATAVPRTGTGRFIINVLGFSTTLGYEPHLFGGMGNFDLDFGTGIFSTRTELLETGLLTGIENSGTGFELNGTGRLSSTNGTFSGQITYSGIAGNIPGTITGGFYGSDARELGATFSATDGNGTTVAGGMTGEWVSTTPSVNLTLTKLSYSEIIETDHAHMLSGTGEPRVGESEFTLHPNGSTSFTSSISSLSSVTLTSANQATAANANFNAYEKTTNGQTVRLETYKVGQENTELKLTYASFGQWQSAPQGSPLADGERVFFAYGLRTPEGALTLRTGSGRYEGVAHGTAFNTVSHNRYNVSGTSSFDVNFSTKAYSGNLALTGTATSGSGQINFGTYQFGGQIDEKNRMYTGLTQSGDFVGSMQAGFYGPNGEEIAGAFGITATDASTNDIISIVGATVATQR